MSALVNVATAPVRWVVGSAKTSANYVDQKLWLLGKKDS